MKEIIIENPVLVKLVHDKEQLVLEGRAKSVELEALEKELEEIKEEEKKYTANYENKELLDKGMAIQEQVNKLIEELNEVAEKLKKEKLGNIPKELVDKHIEKAKKKEKIERELNRIGLKIERIKTRYIPKIQKIARPQLTDEFDDLDTSILRDGKIVVTVFNHVEEFKKNYLSRKK